MNEQYYLDSFQSRFKPWYGMEIALAVLLDEGLMHTFLFYLWFLISLWFLVPLTIGSFWIPQNNVQDDLHFFIFPTHLVLQCGIFFASLVTDISKISNTFCFFYGMEHTVGKTATGGGLKHIFLPMSFRILMVLWCLGV